MRKIKFLALMLVASLACVCFVACGDNKEDEPKIPSQTETPTQKEEVEESRYYVKYEAQMPSKWTNTIKTITYASEKGRQEFNTTEKSWEGTYGPLKKGDKVYLTIKSQSPDEYNYVQSYNKARIYVSRDKEPFVIKAEREGREDLTLVYTIDF